MSEFKGTPAPWAVNTIGKHWNNKDLTHLEVTFGDDGECICDTVYLIEDANLIAAAPELLDALRRLEVSVNTMSYCYRSRPENFAASLRCSESDAEYARAIIAKALGE